MSINLWDKLPNESHKAYMVFCAYRDMGIYRSIKKTCAKLGRQPNYKTWLSEWSVKYNWVERVEAYDHYIANRDKNLYEARILHRRNSLLEDELLMMLKLKDHILKVFELSKDMPLGSKTVMNYTRDEKGGISTNTITSSKHVEFLSNIERKIEQFSRLGRRALRLPTEYTEEPDTSLDGQLDEIEKALKSSLDDIASMNELEI